MQTNWLNRTMNAADQIANSPSLTGGALVAFVCVGLLTFTLARVYKNMTDRSEPEDDQSASSVPRAIKRSELAAATGENGAPLYIAVKDPFGERITVFDVGSGASFYGPGCPYHLFVGKNATHGLAKSSTDTALVEGDISQLTAVEKDTHMQWYAKYTSKYPQVGWLVDDASTGDDDVASSTTVDTVSQTESKKDA